MSPKPAMNGRHSSPRQSTKPGVIPKEYRELVSTTEKRTANLSHKSPEQVVIDRWHREGGVPVVEILWVDAVSLGDDWISDEDLGTDPAPSLALGYLLSESPMAVTIAALVNEEHFANGITIPRSCILQIKHLTDGS